VQCLLSGGFSLVLADLAGSNFDNDF